MTLSRQVIEPKNPALDQSQKFGLPLSPAVRGGDFVFLSGMAAIDPATGAPAHGTVAAETRQILTNIGELLEAAGSSLAKVVKVNVLIYSMLEYENMNSVYREFFPTDPPARTVCGAKLIGGHKVEIDCIALAGAAGLEPPDRLHRGSSSRRTQNSMSRATPTCRIRRASRPVTTFSCPAWGRLTRSPTAAISGRSPSRSARRCTTWRICSNPAGPVSTVS